MCCCICYNNIPPATTQISLKTMNNGGLRLIMNDEMARRDFIKYSVATGVLIAAGDSMNINAFAEEKATINEVDKVTIWVLAANSRRSRPPIPRDLGQ